MLSVMSLSFDFRCQARNYPIVKVHHAYFPLSLKLSLSDKDTEMTSQTGLFGQPLLTRGKFLSYGAFEVYVSKLKLLFSTGEVQSAAR